MKIIFTIILYFFYAAGFAQVKPELSEPSTYWKDKTSMFLILPNTEGEIIFLGDSITDRCEWNEMFTSTKVKNRGLSGDETFGVLNRLDEVLESNPSQIFLMIGVNDLRHEVPFETVVKNYKEIVENIRTKSSSTEIIIQSLLPVNNNIKDAKTENGLIKKLNEEIKQISGKNDIIFVDLFSLMIDDKGNLKEEYSNDGLHINGAAYLIWKAAINSYIKL